ncbi:MAG: DNA mismatch repair endonuclease MutL [Saprospiraceae bacterium]|nr:DNA mismatch repair endonuclease MutL [Saprospiraceae bacterium]
MADIIQLLPDSIANQIAAGEVVQRPASVVKELLENAIDAGARFIKLILKDAGKQVIQVIDDGAGMSNTDARMSLERHATSKINKTEDLFAIRTFGFRGEALASIAAVAQVDLKTKMHGSEVGTQLIVEGSKLIRQEICETTPGTNIQVKNLFYNIPARRKFLKSNTVELRHILDEFQRIAIAHPEIHFEVFHNQTETYHLPSDGLRKRIVNLFGKTLNDRLVPIEEETELCNISGYIGKPESAKRRRGEQFFLINNRFIKSAYLNHAVLMAYENLIAPGSYPFYALYLQMDPSRIDVNVHPTKQEIKFEDEKLTYNIIRSAVRHALSQHNITPTLDFEQSPGLSNLVQPKPVSQGSDKIIIPSSFSREQQDISGWEALYEGIQKTQSSQIVEDKELLVEEDDKKAPVQIHQAYIITQIKSGFLIIDQQHAHERILYEQYLIQLQRQAAHVQKLLFPINFELSTEESILLTDLLPQVNQLGFEVEGFGKNTFILHGMPAHLAEMGDEVVLFHKLLEQFQLNIDLQLSEEQRLALSLAKSACMKKGKVLSEMEMEALIGQLFSCEVPFQSPSGKKCFLSFDMDQLQQKFNQ